MARNICASLLNNIGAMVALVVGIVALVIIAIIIGLKMPKIIANSKAKRQERLNAKQDAAAERERDLNFEGNLFATRDADERAEKKRLKEQRRATNSTKNTNSVMDIVQKQDIVITEVEKQERKATQRELERQDSVINTLQHRHEIPEAAATNKPQGEQDDHYAQNVVGLMKNQDIKRGQQ